MRCRRREDGKTRETGVEGGEGRERERKESARDFGKPIGVSIREGVSIRSVSIREGPLYTIMPTVENNKKEQGKRNEKTTDSRSGFFPDF